MVENAAITASGGTGKDARWVDIHEDALDEGQMAAWVMQAAALPGGLPLALFRVPPLVAFP